MAKFEIGFSFYIDLTDDYEDSIGIKDKLLDEIDGISEIVAYSVENDGEDWCIYCIAEVECETSSRIDDMMLGLLPDVYWDYHYIKGIDNDYNWQP